MSQPIRKELLNASLSWKCGHQTDDLKINGHILYRRTTPAPSTVQRDPDSSYQPFFYQFSEFRNILNIHTVALRPGTYCTDIAVCVCWILTVKSLTPQMFQQMRLDLKKQTKTHTHTHVLITHIIHHRFSLHSPKSHGWYLQDSYNRLSPEPVPLCYCTCRIILI